MRAIPEYIMTDEDVRREWTGREREAFNRYCVTPLVTGQSEHRPIRAAIATCTAFLVGAALFAGYVYGAGFLISLLG